MLRRIRQPHPHRTMLITVDIVIYPGFKALEAIGPLSVFSYANVHLEQRGLDAGYDVRLAAPQSGEVRSDTGVSLHASKALNPLAVPHTALIVGARQIEQAVDATPQIVDWVKAAAPRMQRTAALCTGAFFVAAAGLLDGKRATTHWASARSLQERYPAVRVDPDSIFIREGALWTSAGVTAGIDLALALVEEDFGAAVSLDVARDLVVYLKRPGGQSQFSAHLASQTTSHPGIRDLQDWLLANLATRVGAAEMAARLSMSVRNFNRCFQRETGMTPSAFIERARVEAARRMLEQGDLPAKTIAADTGFGQYEAMRKAFQKLLGITPVAYRERFGPAQRPASAHDGSVDAA
ncbi:AraC family transcriptional regulator [Burkholderia pseudomultivorans]|nr:AraC family transcriptional regulator [Burkholderia pseudomultivorans]EGD01534.1 AraC family transcriptional regulator [Burkholderia sp. TJI49]KVC20938.1 AraC family transcriptional regulator [Burkholderia pseudomultivorans]KVC39834.1 AraC family transcriptional regulator [Burkholderia pseudomultivorans]KVC50549.1 AraC family transcriptional regulator [Burkholderia pseudomultivorans]